MTHPLNLHAVAALWSLRQAWTHAVDAKRRALRALFQDHDHGTLQAWRPNGIGGTLGGGGHADTIGEIVISGDRYGGDIDHCERLAQTAHDDIAQAAWLVVAELGLPARSITAVADLAVRITEVRPATAKEITRWLAEADRKIRRSLQLEPTVATVDGNPECPACTVRLLQLQTAAPDRSDWTVTCGAGCRCRGAACGCGMPVRADGVAHIWRLATLPAPAQRGKGARVPSRRRRAA